MTRRRLNTSTILLTWARDKLCCNPALIIYWSCSKGMLFSIKVGFHTDTVSGGSCTRLASISWNISSKGSQGVVSLTTTHSLHFFDAISPSSSTYSKACFLNNKPLPDFSDSSPKVRWWLASPYPLLSPLKSRQRHRPSYHPGRGTQGKPFLTAWEPLYLQKEIR